MRCLPLRTVLPRSCGSAFRFSLRSCLLLIGKQLSYGSISLINGLVRVGSRGRIRIRDRDAPKRPPRYVTRPLALRPIRIPKRVVLVGISVRPAIDHDRFDISAWVEAAGVQHASQLIANVSLER